MECIVSQKLMEIEEANVPFPYLFVSGDPKESKDKTIHEMKDNST
jgi:hypothetical protein